LNPIWNEVATFDVETGHEVVEVEVFDRDDFGKDDFEGGFTIRLDNSKLGLQDQEQHDHWFQLNPPADARQNIKWTGKVRFTLHYMYSRTILLTGFVNKWSLQIDNEMKEYNDLKKVL
jgi:Ca2+-dependent lipid-binding protein